jgi:transposase-like protein
MKTFSSKLFFMSKTRKERCPHCGFLDVIKWGRQSGHQRFKCKNCGSLFTFRRKDVSQSNRFVWFEWWVMGKQTLEQIADLSGYSTRQLSRWFDEYLEDYPTWHINGNERVNLLIDGTWFPNKLCLVLYRDETVKSTLFYRLTDDEWAEEIEEDLRNIQSLGIEIESVTSDGGRNIIKAVNAACPNALRQRCLAHIQRECLTWLTRHPQSMAGKDLRKIVVMISQIETRNDMLYWKRLLSEWHDQYVSYINTRTIKAESHREWFTHKMVRKAYAHLRGALPNMFVFVEHPGVPKTTNALESFFGHLKGNISLHRGLSKKHYKNYVKWYLFFRQKSSKKGQGA